jgi:hypothetical protein
VLDEIPWIAFGGTSAPHGPVRVSRHPAGIGVTVNPQGVAVVVVVGSVVVVGGSTTIVHPARAMVASATIARTDLIGSSAYRSTHGDRRMATAF